MDLIEKENPVGIDKVISELQRSLFIYLTQYAKWEYYQSFPRAYRNRNKKDVVPEVYIGKGDYKSCLFDDTKNATSFFLADEKRVYDPEKFVWTQDVAMIFQVRLNKLFKDCNNRADEELIDTLRNAINKTFWDRRLDEIITGVDNVYQGLKWNYDKKYYDDMGDYNVVRINFKLLYSNNEQVTSLK